jgi:hypothetical protein
VNCLELLVALGTENCFFLQERGFLTSGETKIMV